LDCGSNPRCPINWFSKRFAILTVKFRGYFSSTQNFLPNGAKIPTGKGTEESEAAHHPGAAETEEIPRQPAVEGVSEHQTVKRSSARRQSPLKVNLARLTGH